MTKKTLKNGTDLTKMCETCSRYGFQLILTEENHFMFRIPPHEYVSVLTKNDMDFLASVMSFKEFLRMLHKEILIKSGCNEYSEELSDLLDAIYGKLD